ncbi:MAG: 4a-hydroxytetrahydrobiopterin dehydratase [Propionicimonas sp.]|nr:4a-hydroxytetrahydrobiopterin dehydratase [Propionicimonas sp.]
MTDAITPGQFRDSAGVSDWQPRDDGAHALFQTGSFATGVALVVEIGRLADAADHHPDVGLTYPAVAVRVYSHDVGGLSERDVALARAISAVAGELGLRAARA